MKIKEPDWLNMFLKGDYLDADRGSRWLHSGEYLPRVRAWKTWFADNIAPYEFYDPKNAVEVRSYKRQDGEFSTWERPEFCNDRTHTALLINIEPIKKETVEDALRDLVNSWDGNPGSEMTVAMAASVGRARRLLGAPPSEEKNK